MTDGTYRTRSGALVQLKGSMTVHNGKEFAYDKVGNVTHIGNLTRITKDRMLTAVKEKQHPMDLMERLDGLHSFSERP
jgi:hypothetical protein